MPDFIAGETKPKNSCLLETKRGRNGKPKLLRLFTSLFPALNDRVNLIGAVGGPLASLSSVAHRKEQRGGGSMTNPADFCQSQG